MTYLGRLRTHAIMAITIFKFEICAFFFMEKRKNITVNHGMFASHLSDRKSSARRFNLGARSLFL